MTQRASQWILVLLCLGLAGLGSNPAWAEEPTPSPPEAAAEFAEPAPGVSVSFDGVRVFIDPKTGKFRQPTAAELEQMAARKSAPADEPEIEIGPNGELTAILPGRYMKAAVATLGTGGQLTVEHDSVPVTMVELPEAPGAKADEHTDTESATCDQGEEM